MSASQLSKNRTIKQFGAIQSVLRIRRAEIIISTYRAHSLHREFNILLWNMNYLHNKTFRGCWKLCSWRRIFVFISFNIRTNWNLIQWWNDQWDLGNILNHCIYNEKPNNKNIFIYIYCIISSITYKAIIHFFCRSLGRCKVNILKVPTKYSKINYPLYFALQTAQSFWMSF